MFGVPHYTSVKMQFKGREGCMSSFYKKINAHTIMSNILPLPLHR